MKHCSGRSLLLLIIICLASVPSAAQVAVETYSGTQTITMIMPGTQMGDSIQFNGLLKFTTLAFTPGAVVYQDTLIDFSGNEPIFIAADYIIVLKFPNLPGSTQGAVGTWTVTAPLVNFNGTLEWQNVELGPSFSPTSFDVVPASTFTSLVSDVLWNGLLIPELNGNIVSIDGTHTVTSVNPANGIVNMTASGTISAQSVPTGVGDPPPIRKTVLRQNYPNPFNPATAIQFSLPRALLVNLSIFDIEGKRIVTLADGILTGGQKEFRWDGRNSNGNPVSSGIYIYRLHAGDNVQSRKMVLLK